MLKPHWKPLTCTLIMLVLLVAGITLWYHWQKPEAPAPIAPATPAPLEISEPSPDDEPGEATINDTLQATPQDASPPEPPPPLTREQLPDALPDTATPENWHIWEALVNEAVKDDVLMQKLLPNTKEKAFETLTHLMNSVNDLDLMSIFTAAMWRKIATLYPNEPEVLFMHIGHLSWGPRATRAEKEEFVAAWERLKRLNDEHNIPLTSRLRKTHSLSQTYVDLGQYEKAIENIKEQNERITALKRARIHDMRMYHGILPLGTVIELQKLLDAQRQNPQEKQEE